MALPQQGASDGKTRFKIDVAQLVSRGTRLELTMSEDGAPAEFVTAPTDRLMALSHLMAQGFKLETTGADAVGPHTVDTLVRVQRVPV